MKGMELFKIFVLAMLCEAIWETIKMTWQNGKFSLDRLGALLLGILLAMATKMDILSLAGLNAIYPVIGMACTGVIVSRGANFTHDLLNLMSDTQVSQRLRREELVNRKSRDS